MTQNPNYRAPNNKEFGDAMSRALKSMKERRRKHLIAGNINQRDIIDNDEDVSIQRRRLESSPVRDEQVIVLESTDFRRFLFSRF